MADALAPLRTKLTALVEQQLSLRWTPPGLAKNLQAALESVASIGATIEIANPAGNNTPPSAGRATDALSLGVGVSAAVSQSISLGLSLNIGISATASLLLKVGAGLNEAISRTNDLERSLIEFNAASSAASGHRGVMPAGRKVEQGPVNKSLRSLNEKLNEAQQHAYAAAEARPVSPISAELRLPRMGAWYCDLDIDADVKQAGKVRFKLDDLEHVGTIIPDKTGTEGSRAKCRVLAGNGRITSEVSPRSYSHSSGVTIGTVVRDILKDAGEDLSDLSDSAALDRRLARWHLAAGTAAQALTALAEKNGCAWRMLRDGTVWFGEETWPEVEPEGVLTDEDWSSGHLTLASETPNMVPGTVYQGQKIEHVVHRYGETLRTEIRTTSPGAALQKALRGKQQEVDFSREYPCKVVTQNTDGTLQLLPDDEVMRSRGLDNVPIRYGMPGMKATIASGARCHLAFAAGDPSRPFVCSWEYDPSKVTLVSVLDGGRSFARVGDIVQGGGPGTVVTFWPVPPALPAPPNGAVIMGVPYFISFSAIPLTAATVATAAPLFSAIAGGAEKFQG